jgi:hypothetical protein
MHFIHSLLSSLFLYLKSNPSRTMGSYPLYSSSLLAPTYFIYSIYNEVLFYLLSLLVYRKDGIDRFPWNVDTYMPNCMMILGKWPAWHTILFYKFIFIFNSLHVSNTLCSSSGETNCVNTTSGSCHSVLVAGLCAGWNFTSDLHMTWPPTATRGCIDTICLSWWWARCVRNM